MFDGLLTDSTQPRTFFLTTVFERHRRVGSSSGSPLSVRYHIQFIGLTLNPVTLGSLFLLQKYIGLKAQLPVWEGSWG